MGLAKAHTFVHVRTQAAIGRSFARQTPKSGERRFLAGIADRAAAALQGLGQADLLEVAGGQLARKLAHGCVVALRPVIDQD